MSYPPGVTQWHIDYYAGGYDEPREEELELAMGDWPKHPDGTPKKMGEMTREEQREQFEAAGARLQREFQQPAVKAALAKILKS